MGVCTTSNRAGRIPGASRRALDYGLGAGFGEGVELLDWVDGEGV
jgi:hypothetical protein